MIENVNHIVMMFTPTFMIFIICVVGCAYIPDFLKLTGFNRAERPVMFNILTGLLCFVFVVTVVYYILKYYNITENVLRYGGVFLIV